MHCRIDAYGTIDELNAQLGVVRALKPYDKVDSLLEQIQNQLFVLGADLAAPFDLRRQIQNVFNKMKFNSLKIQLIEWSYN